MSTELKDALNLAKRCAEASWKSISSAREAAFRAKDIVLAELLVEPHKSAIDLAEALCRANAAFNETHSTEAKP